MVYVWIVIERGQQGGFQDSQENSRVGAMISSLWSVCREENKENNEWKLRLWVQNWSIPFKLGMTHLGGFMAAFQVQNE